MRFVKAKLCTVLSTAEPQQAASTSERFEETGQREPLVDHIAHAEGEPHELTRRVARLEQRHTRDWEWQRPPSRDSDGRFCGPRLNVESVPRLPTFPARWVLDDPRRRAHLVFWTSQHDRRLLLALRLERADRADGVRILTLDGDIYRLQLASRPLPRRGGEALLYRCPVCWWPRRYLYPFALTGGRLTGRLDVRCQACAGYRWASQGSYRSSLDRAFRAELGVRRDPLPRDPWDSRAVSDPRLIADEFPEPFAAVGLP